MNVEASDELKLGKKIPIPKKYKDPKEVQNYRGITIASTLGSRIYHLTEKRSFSPVLAAIRI